MANFWTYLYHFFLTQSLVNAYSVILRVPSEVQCRLEFGLETSSQYQLAKRHFSSSKTIVCCIHFLTFALLAIYSMLIHSSYNDLFIFPGFFQSPINTWNSIKVFKSVKENLLLHLKEITLIHLATYKFRVE